MKLGILGGGQLARMLSLAAYPLGIQTVCLDPTPNPCASAVTEVITANFEDEAAIRALLSQVEVVTIETENIPVSTGKLIQQTHPFYPSLKALEISQDRYLEKSFFNQCSIATAEFRPIESEQDLADAVLALGFPAVLKTRRFGYDGKGQYVLRSESCLAPAWDTLGSSPLILEKFIDFVGELSLIAVRGKQGEIRFYPLTLNQHQNGILHTSEAPFLHDTLQQQAQQQAIKLLEALDYVGVLTIEFFYDGQQLIANEIAPRVHNSGHWTIEGARTSQFENHLRAVCDLPLGSTEPVGHSFLLNCVGTMLPQESCLHLPGIHYHTYGKEARPNRKLGHITLVDSDFERFQLSKHALCSAQAQP